MKTTITIGLLATIALGLAVFSCDTKDTDTSFNPILTGKMRIAFDNIVGTTDLKLNTDTYQNAVGESFVVTKFNYFVSNIRLRKADGSEYVVPQDSSYFLIQEEKPASQTITLANVPTGNYTGVTFMIGVDSLRSLADISKRTGVLDPGLNDGMYWEWNSGYIFLKLEGTSAVAPALQNNAFFYHIGGFGGGYNGKKTINNLRTITIPFKTDVAQVQANAIPSVRLTANVLSLFNGATKLSIAQNSSVMFDPYSTNIADNYAQMFSYDRIQANQ
ncbi:MbnP family protein [Spirosoma flavum]|uniref:MbnP family protein n=1 Tax=Spirosoma flavum TaxID=2048557 RepID=A0ABW6AHS1_9BACT